MSDTETPADAFASVTSDDVRPGETPAQARTRRKTEQRRAQRAAKAPKAPTPPKSPPASSTPKETPPARPVGRPTVKARRTQATLGVIGMAGVAVRPFNVADSDAILAGAEALAEALAEVADTNRAIARALDAISGTSAWAGVALAVYAIAAPIAVNHGVFGLGVERPAVEPVAPPAPTIPEPGAADFDPAAIRWSAGAGVQV